MAHITTLTRAYNDLHNSQANTYSYSGSFETFKESEVKVKLDDTLLTYNSSPSDNTQYSVNLTDKTIHVGGGNLSSGTLSIYPETDLGAPTLKAPYTAGSAVTANDLTNNQKQVMRKLMEFDENKLSTSGGTLTGDLTLGEDAKIIFEGATDNAYETTLTVADPTADRTITIPNVTGTVVTTGDTNTVTSTMITDGTIVNADVNASAAIDGTKVSPNFGSQNISTSGTLASGAQTITGNIIVSGTVDGRDVATDGTKLDGIENNATADQTASDIQGLGFFTTSNDGTGSGLDADLLDGYHGSSYLRSDTSDTFDASSGHSITFNDNTHLKIGSGGDLAIHHDGNHTFITQTNSGQTYAAFVNGATFRGGANHQDLVKFVNTGSGGSARVHVELYEGEDSLNNTTKRLETTSTGVTITGETKTTSLEINGTDVLSTPAELNILDGATLNTNELNILDGVTADKDEINLLDGKTIVTTIAGNATDAQLPSAQAVNERIVELVTEVGGFHPIVNETSFPTTNPDINDGAGTIVSIADAGGLKVADGSGSGTYAGTAGNSIGATTTAGTAVTITGIDTTLRGTTIGAGKGMLVETTTTLNEYTYHRLVLDESGVSNADTLVSNFNEKYYGPLSSNPATKPSGANRVNGDLYFNTSDGKMKVFNGSHSSGTWDDVAAPGNFFINTLSSSGSNSDSPPGGSATFNGTARKFTLSNPPNSAQQLLVSVNGVVQKPNSGTSPSEGFAIDGSDIIFASAPASNAPFFIVTIGSSVNIGTPSDNTDTSAKIVDGTIVNGDISSSAAIALSKLSTSGTPNNTNFLRGDGAWTTVVTDLVNDSSPQLGGNLDSNTRDIHLNNSGDVALRWQLSGTNKWSIFHNTSGSSNHLEIFDNNGSKTAAKFLTNGAAELYYSGTKRFETNNTGAFCTGELGCDTLYMSDNDKVKLGSNDDLQIYHAGDHSYIKDTGTGQLRIWSDDLRIQDTSGNSGIQMLEGGAVYLYHSGNQKFETTSTGAAITGSLGIGNTSPIGTLEVYDGTFVLSKPNSNASSRNWRFLADNAAAGNLGLQVSTAAGGSTFSNVLEVDSSGNVLIGTTNTTTVGTVNKNLVVGSTTNNDEVAMTLNVMEGTNNRRVKFFLDDDDGVYGVDSTASTGVAPFVVRGSGTQQFRFDGDGLKFNTDTAAANGLDDYEEGIYTPTLTGYGSTTSFTLYSSEDTLSYVKIGNNCWINGRIRINDDQYSGYVRMTLPFTSAQGTDCSNCGMSAVATHGVTFADSIDKGLFFETYTNATLGVFVFQREDTGWTNATNAHITGNNYLTFNHHYVTQ